MALIDLDFWHFLDWPNPRTFFAVAEYSGLSWDEIIALASARGMHGQDAINAGIRWMADLGYDLDPDAWKVVLQPPYGDLVHSAMGSAAVRWEVRCLAFFRHSIITWSSFYMNACMNGNFPAANRLRTLVWHQTSYLCSFSIHSPVMPIRHPAVSGPLSNPYLVPPADLLDLSSTRNLPCAWFGRSPLWIDYDDPLDCAQRYAFLDPAVRIAVAMPASPTRPGGDFRFGATDFEADVVRRSDAVRLF